MLFTHTERIREALKGEKKMKDTTISQAVRYVGADDKTIDLFEGQYVVPNGI